MSRRRRLHLTIAALTTVAVLVGAGGFIGWWNARPEAYRPGQDHDEITKNLARSLPDGAPVASLTDVTADAGIGDFRSFVGPRSSQLPEDMGSGAAWGDFDDDGDDDLFLVSAGGALEARSGDRGRSRLFENRGNGAFEEVEIPDLRFTGMAAAWGDADGDGRLDVVVTGRDRLVLLRNTDEGFVRDERLPEPRGFWAGVSWGDFDNDRDLDLYVCGYVQYVVDDADRAKAMEQFGRAVPYTLNPSAYEPQPNLLFRNDDGAFTEIAAELGVDNPRGRSLGALWWDLDQDGLLDLYVANDVSDNVLYRNTGGAFEEISHAALVADYRGAMGLTAGDYDRDGDDDVFVTHWIAQENALYESLLTDARTREQRPTGDGPSAAPVRFMDVASLLGLGQSTIQHVGWGAEFADLDGDGWIDLVVANGSTFESAGEPKQLKPEQSLVFWNHNGQSFHDLTPGVPALALPRVSRGLALSDYDLDGDVDVLFVHHGEGVQLLRNDMQRGAWLTVTLRSRGPAGELTGRGEGSTVIVEAGGVVHRRTVSSASYLSQSSQTLHFGLGDAVAVDRVEVRWLGGSPETYEGMEIDGRWELRESEPPARRLAVAAAPPAGAAPMDDRERVVAFWESQRAAMHAMKVDDDPVAAIALFRQALVFDPRHEGALYDLANCLANTGEMAEALEQLDRLLAVNPRSHRGLKRKGTLLALTAASPDDLQAARAVVEQALAINREETGALLLLGELDLLLGDDASADQRLGWACRTNPRAVSGFFLRGYLAWKRGDAAGATALLEQARAARGEAWKPEGTTAEGDTGTGNGNGDDDGNGNTGTARQAASTPLARFWDQAWDGTLDPDKVFAALDAHLQQPADARRAPDDR
ncbi:MAG: FG-GAP-like repeat-containing protein [Planctomycetota bacterium]|jgi:tetratricopeptide (TPR) repeat protein